MDIWSRYELRIAEIHGGWGLLSDLLAQSGGTNSPWVVSEVRQAAAWAGEEAHAEVQSEKPEEDRTSRCMTLP